MHELIKQYIGFLSKLTLPLANESLDEILAMQLPQAVKSLPAELRQHVELLHQIFACCQALKKDRQKQLDRPRLDNALAEQKKTAQKRQLDMTALSKRIQQQKNELQSMCLDIQTQHHEAKTKANPLLARPALGNSSVKNQCRLVRTIEEETSSELQKINSLRARKKLLELQQEREEYIRRLHQQGMPAADRFSGDLGAELSMLEEEQRYLLETGLQLQNCQKYLAYHLSQSNMENNHEQLQQSLTELQGQWYKEQEDERTDSLPEERKQDLRKEAKDFPSLQIFIEGKKKQLNDLGSYFSLSAWSEWWHSKDFSSRQQQLAADIQFLELLHRQEMTRQKITAVQKTMEGLSQLPSDHSLSFAIPSLESTLSTCTALLKELHEKYHCLHLLSVSSHPSQVDLFADLIMAISAVNSLAEAKSKLKRDLAQIKELNQTIASLRLEHKLIENYSTDSLTDLELRLKSEQENEDFLLTMEELCRSYSANVDTYGLAKNELKLKQAAQASLAKSIQSLQKQLREIPELEHRIKETEDTLQRAFEQIKSLPPVREEEASLLPALNSIDYSELEKWHEQISHHHSLSEKQAAWYKPLFTRLKEQTRSTAELHQACHLLRDIHFELNNPDPRFPVLEHYQSLCPHPERGLRPLLKLKPQSPLLSPLKNRLSNKRMEKALQNLREKSEELKKRKHFREAELLSQAVISLHHRALAVESNEKADAGRLTDDARYACLQNHRGGLRLWQMLENAFKSLTSGSLHQQSSTAMSRSCFFTTASQRLLEKAEYELSQSMLW